MDAMFSRLRALFRNLTDKNQNERDLADEVGSYVELSTARKMRAGLSENEARREATLELGGVEQVKEQVRGARAGSSLESFILDLRYGLRFLLKKPWFTSTAVIALALGIGANTAIFSVINGVLLRSLPYANPEGIVLLAERQITSTETTYVVSPGNFHDWAERNHCFDQMAILSNAGGANVTGGGGEPEEIGIQVVTPSFFSVLGVPPLLGRVFSPDEGTRGRNQVVILSYQFWQSRFGADPKILGKPLTLNGGNYEIVGVMPAGFQFLNTNARAWAPTALDPAVNYRAATGRFMQAFARLKPGVTIQQAQAEMSALSNQVEKEYPQFNGGWSVRLVPLREAVVGEIRPILIVLLATVAFVLLIACVNVASLMLARAAARQKEFALRAALGAARIRLIRQMLTESMLLGLVGGVLGVFLAYWGLQILIGLGPDSIPRLHEITIDLRVLAFTFVISLLTGVLFGLIPAFQTSRPDLNEALKAGSRTSTTRGSRIIRNTFVVTEVSLALVLLIGAGLMIRSFIRLRSVDPGFEPHHVLTMRFGLSSTKYEKPDEIVGLFRDVQERIASLPGVQAVGAINYLPLTGPAAGATSFKIVGRAEAAQGAVPNTEVRVVTPRYFSAMNIDLLKGRIFDEHDGRESRVLLINEAMAKRFFPAQDPIGQHLVINWETNEIDEIVGVVGDNKEAALDQEPKPAIYWPHARLAYSKMALIIRTSGDAMRVSAAAQREVRRLLPDQPIDVRTMDAVISSSIARPRFNTLLLGIFAGVALVLASVGLYGVMNYSATQRSHEIGIRMALGATRSDIMRLIVGNGMLLTLIGIAIGVAASIGLTRLMQSFLFGVRATDTITFVGVSALLVVVALIANYIPARRATRIDPVKSLRCE